MSLAFSPLPAEVRTARLLAVAMGRRSGLPDEALDEVRLAVGEACSRAVAVHGRLGSAEPVEATFAEDERGYVVTITDLGSPDAVAPADLEALVVAADHDGDLPPGLDLAVVAGLVDDLDVAPVNPVGTRLTLRWKR